MWARKVVINLSKRFILLFWVILFPSVAVIVMNKLEILNLQAQAQQKKSEKRQPASRKEKTVGDVLKKIEGKRLSINKGQSILPQFKNWQPKTQPNLRIVKPPSSTALYYDESSDEAELEKISDEGINQLYKLTNKFRNSKKRGELWLRLAELYVEKSRLIDYRVHQEYDKKLRESRQDGKRQNPPKINLSAAQEYNRKAIQLYEWFLRDFPKDPKVDQALFFLGFNYFELGDEKKGMSFYQRLTQEFPRSPFVDESNFALGEFHFENEHWKEALPYYLKVSQNKRARLFSFALYKSAWCQYKMGKVKEGLQSLEQVIKAGRIAKSQEDKKGVGVSRIRLATEALKDLVIFYAEVGSYQGAKDYFAEVAGAKNVFSLQEKLAYYYTDTGQRAGARYIFHELIETNPSSPKAYDYQYQIVSLYVSSGEGKLFKQELYNWIQGYGPDSSWQKTNSDNKELIAKATQLIETTLRNYVLQQHQTAQNSHAPNAQAAASSGYELYFRVFKTSPKLDEMHFFYAELLYDIQDYSRASDHYLWVAENSPRSVYYDKAVLNAILSLEKKLPTSEEIKKIVGETTAPVEFDVTIKKFEKVVLRFLKNFPKGSDAVAIKYRLAALYYYYNQFDKALAGFKEIIHSDPSSKYAEYSANLTLDIYNIKNDFDGLESAGKEILSIPQLASSAVGAQIKTILEKASFKRAQNMESNKDYMGSAEQFESFAGKNSQSDLAFSAKFNSAVNYERAGDLNKALAMYALVLKSPGKGREDLKKKSFKFMAILYEKTGRYKEAAEYFERYANENAKSDKDAVDFFYNAGVIREGMNFYNAALVNYKNYFDRSKRRDRIEVVFLMAKIWQKRGNIKQARSYYSQYVDFNPHNGSAFIESLFQLGVIEEKLGRNKAADDYFKKTVALQKTFAKKGSLVGVSYAAEAQFKIVYHLYEELRSIKIPGNPSAQGIAVQKKLDLINKLKERLKEVIRYDDGYMVVAALTLSGQANQHMSASLYSAPLPKGLNESQIKEYKEGVDKVAKPFQEEALKSYASAIEKGYRLEGYNEWLKAALIEAHRLNSEKFPNFGEEAILTKVPDTMER